VESATESPRGPLGNPLNRERKGTHGVRPPAPSPADLAALPCVRAEEHLPLALYVLRRTLWRHDDDDEGAAFWGLAQAAAQWNAGKRPCAWSTFAAARIRWTVLHRFGRLVSSRVIAAEVPLFLAADDDEEAEIERPEMAVEDPALPEAEARVDVSALLALLSPVAREILVRRFGLDGEPASREEVGAALGLSADQVASRERRALVHLRKVAQRKRLRFSLT